jgi:hypothetical protein
VLSDDLLEDARHLAARGAAEQRQSSMRRAISTVYYAVFHLFLEDFIEHWEFEDQRAQIARMFSHQKMRDAAFDAKDKRNPTPVESALLDVIAAFRQLQADRHRADYDLGWDLFASDVDDAVARANSLFGSWRAIRNEPQARNHLLLMFGGKR